MYKRQVLVTSSIQAELDNDYGRSKREAEELVFAHERATGAPALVYRMPGLFGKWCRPAYNSVVATFCHNIAHGLPIEVRDPAYSLPLCYICLLYTSVAGKAQVGEAQGQGGLDHLPGGAAAVAELGVVVVRGKALHSSSLLVWAYRPTRFTMAWAAWSIFSAVMHS